MTKVETFGETIRNLLSLYDPICDEARVQFSNEGVSSRMTDPSNTGMVDIHVPADGFYDYECESTVVAGYHIKKMQKVASFARKGRGNDKGDDVTLTVEDRRTNVYTQRDDQNVERSTDVFHIDPDSIRQRPDIPEKADVGVTTKASIDVDGFAAVMKKAESLTDCITLHAHDGDVVVSNRDTNDDGADDGFTFADAAVPHPPAEDGDEPGVLSGNDHETEGSLFSTERLNDMAKAAAAVDLDHLTLYFGDECPVYMKYEDVDNGATVRYMLAPRIESE